MKFEDNTVHLHNYLHIIHPPLEFLGLKQFRYQDFHGNFHLQWGKKFHSFTEAGLSITTCEIFLTYSLSVKNSWLFASCVSRIGPVSQVSYAHLLQKIDPFREESSSRLKIPCWLIKQGMYHTTAKSFFRVFTSPWLFHC